MNLAAPFLFARIRVSSVLAGIELRCPNAGNVSSREASPKDIGGVQPIIAGAYASKLQSA